MCQEMGREAMCSLVFLMVDSDGVSFSVASVSAKELRER